MKCSPNDIVFSSNMRNVLRHRDGDTNDIVTTIMRMDSEADRYIDVEAARKCLAGNDKYETARNIWKFVKSNLRYRTDRPGKEVVKSPAALFAIKAGDCKSYSIAEAALLRALGFKGIRYRFVSYGKNRDVTHVYIVATLNGRDVILDAVHSRFDEEVPYTWKRDIPAAKSKAIHGIGKPAAYNSISFTQLIGLGLLAWVMFK